MFNLFLIIFSCKHERNQAFFTSINSNEKEPKSLREYIRRKNPMEHKFREHEAPFLRAFLSRHRGYCYHCGLLLPRQYFKCIRKLQRNIFLVFCFHKSLS